MEKNIAVYCQQLTKTYHTGGDNILALAGIDLSIKMGELMMLVGPSGCGKTTLISVIAGILNQDSGICEVFGHSLNKMGSNEKLKFRANYIGFVFQAYNLLPSLTAAENVSIPLILQGVKRKQAEKKGAEMLAEVGLANRIRSLPAQLSGGQQQRVAIARALVHNPKLIVCDEPTSALDHETGFHVMELLKAVALDQNRTLVIVTHDSRIFGFADRIARMDDGRLDKIVHSINEL